MVLTTFSPVYNKALMPWISAGSTACSLAPQLKSLQASKWLLPLTYFPAALILPALLSGILGVTPSMGSHLGLFGEWLMGGQDWPNFVAAPWGKLWASFLTSGLGLVKMEIKYILLVSSSPQPPLPLNINVYLCNQCALESNNCD